ncbi:MAG: cell division ATP-binding protein FtsE [Rhodospirillales bacterium]
MEPDRDIVRFRNVGMRYDFGAEVLRDISFRIAAGSFHFLTGPSGAGKSSLLRLMHLATAPVRGEIMLFGRDAARMRRRDVAAQRRRIGVVFQELRLLERLTARENVALPLRIAGAPDAAADRRVPELLERLGLGALMDARPAALSGGQRQRVAVARALVTRPELVLADEPTANVDDATALQVMSLLEEHHKAGATVVLATHNRSLVSRFRHPELRIDAGRLSEGAGS